MRAVVCPAIAGILLLQAELGYARKIAVLGPLTGIGIKPQEAKRVEAAIGRQLSGFAGYRFLATARLSGALKRASELDCARQLACVRRYAERIGADQLLTGEVGGLAGAHVINLRLLEVSGKVVRSVTGTLGRRSNAGIRALLVRLLAPEKYTGTLVVAASVQNAWIYLNGQRIGRTPEGLEKELPVGTHALRITHDRYQDYVRFVTVQFGKTTIVTADLEMHPSQGQNLKLRTAPLQPLADSELPWYRRWWAVTGFAVGLVAISATVVALIPRDVRRDEALAIQP